MARGPVVYSPLDRPFLAVAIAVAVVLVALLQVGVVTYAFNKLGVGPQWATVVLLASLAGSMINLPVARLRGGVVRAMRTVTVFGVRYLVPVLTHRDTIIAVNVGGALVPAALSGYLIAREDLGWRALVAVAAVGLLVYLVARPVPGLGIAVPTLLPGICAVLVAILLNPPAALAGLAYVGGTLGTLAGADLANLPKVRRLGAPVVSIGGAGTFDGVFLTGIIAVVLAGFV
ncbi:MAG: DUF1614 domain-containing protein [Micromonosporaceae bacterium]